MLIRSSALLLSFAFLGCAPQLGEAKLAVTGHGRVRSNPAGISCVSGGGVCDAQLGQSFTFIAEADSGAFFDHWEGDELCVSAGRATVTIGEAPDRKVDCTAIFTDGQAPTTTPAQ